MNGELVCFSCLKVGHVSRSYKTRAPAPNNGNDKGKEKVEVRKTWKEIVEARRSGSRKVEITQSNGSVDHTTTN